jgi:hypothetical protein
VPKGLALFETWVCVAVISIRLPVWDDMGRWLRKTPPAAHATATSKQATGRCPEGQLYPFFRATKNGYVVSLRCFQQANENRKF